nr:hypothetical protein GCM10025730_37600 [Promicromonospora thailandica]
MIATAPPEVSVRTFSWPRALVGSYDVFQLHWPESLVRHPTRLGSAVKRFLTRMLLLRLWATRTPLVRTAHNLAPHEAGDPGSGGCSLPWTGARRTGSPSTPRRSCRRARPRR